MALTFIGAIQAVIGMLLLIFGTMPAMFAFLLYSGLFGGSAAITLPALGGSSIPPIQFALVFLFARIVLPGGGQIPRLIQAIRANLPLIAFVGYGIALAYIGPRLFHGQIDVTPLRGQVQTRYASSYAAIYAVAPLGPRSQNITTSVYLAGTMLLAISAYVSCTHARGRDMLVRCGITLGWLHAALGVIGVIVNGTPAQLIFQLIRNGNYAQLDQSFNGFVRINGIWPEASSYASYGFVWFVFLFECWFRGVRPRATGLIALVLAAILVLSGSSTAFVGLGIYAAVFAARCVLIPYSLRFDRIVSLAAAALALVILASAAMVLQPELASSFVELVRHITVEKSGSLSGLQRSFWAKQGLAAFSASHGIGIGPGSFRSSSIVTAILGCMGIVGIVTFILYFVNVWKPWRGTTFVPSADPDAAIGAAASWAAFALLIVASIQSPTCDPGPEFAVFAGCALALRQARTHPAARRPATPRQRPEPAQAA